MERPQLPGLTAGGDGVVPVLGCGGDPGSLLGGWNPVAVG
jgi:hypothetical protein